MVAEGSLDVMVLAVDVAGDRTADGDEACAGGDRDEPTLRHEHPQELVDAHPGRHRHGVAQLGEAQRVGVALGHRESGAQAPDRHDAGHEVLVKERRERQHQPERPVRKEHDGHQGDGHDELRQARASSPAGHDANEPDELAKVLAHQQALGLPVVNAAEKAVHCTRVETAELVRGVENLIVPKALRFRLDPQLLEPLRLRIKDLFAFPVILRSVGEQEGANIHLANRDSDLPAIFAELHALGCVDIAFYLARHHHAMRGDIARDFAG